MSKVNTQKVRKSDLCTCGMSRLVPVFPFLLPRIFSPLPRSAHLSVLNNHYSRRDPFQLEFQGPTPHIHLQRRAKKKRDAPCFMQAAPRLNLGILSRSHNPTTYNPMSIAEQKKTGCTLVNAGCAALKPGYILNRSS